MKSQIKVNMPIDEALRAQSILQSCVHCGMCLATCPSYQITANELDSPRGRIYLIKSALEGNAVSTQTQKYLDQCLLCQKCEITCPAGVEYTSLYAIGQKYLTGQIKNPKRDFKRKLILWLLHPTLFKVGLKLAKTFRFLFFGSLAQKIPSAKKSCPHLR